MGLSYSEINEICWVISLVFPDTLFAFLQLQVRLLDPTHTFFLFLELTDMYHNVERDFSYCHTQALLSTTENSRR